MESGKAPGINGLPVDFYKSFWSELKEDLLEVLNESLAEGQLPVSCHRAVLTLLPKKGDLTEIKCWRPVSLLCSYHYSDYKLLSLAKLIILETKMDKMDRESSRENWNAVTRPKDKTILYFSGSPTHWPWQGCCWYLPRESNAVRRSCFLKPTLKTLQTLPLPRPFASVRFEPPA